MTIPDTDIRIRIASMFTDEGEDFERKLDQILSLIAEQVAAAEQQLLTELLEQQAKVPYNKGYIEYVPVEVIEKYREGL